MKIVLEVKGSENPKNDDILVYDKELECWQICSKNEFLKDIRKEFNDLKEEFKKTQEKCIETQENVQTMAKIMKEGMK